MQSVKRGCVWCYNESCVTQQNWEARIKSVLHLVQEYTHQLANENGVAYKVYAYGEPRADGIWEGWLEFKPSDITQPILRTNRETTQPNKAALEYWASGLEPLYLEGAFVRARSK